jgi:hypothetical protein
MQMYWFIQILLLVSWLLHGILQTMRPTKVLPPLNINNSSYSAILHRPVGIRVRVGPQHPLVCRKSRQNGAIIRMRPWSPVSKQVWHDNDPSLFKGPEQPSIGLNLAALQRQWWRLHISETIKAGRKISINQSTNQSLKYLYCHISTCNIH